MNPKISIITVTYNCEHVIRSTIESVLRQTYSNIEYIVVDGASKDGTFGIVQEYGNKITKAISEPDKSLYDAMNKAQKMATGDFIWFINAGDSIYSVDTTEKMVKFCESDTDILYGEVMMVDQSHREMGVRSKITTQILPKNLTWKSLKHGMVVCHQAFVPRRSIVKEYIPNNIAADIDWVIHALKKSRKNTFVPVVLANFETGGASRQNYKQSFKNRYSILKKQFGWLPNIWNHIVILLRAFTYKVLGKSKY